jgi:hypothetical protein
VFRPHKCYQSGRLREESCGGLHRLEGCTVESVSKRLQELAKVWELHIWVLMSRGPPRGCRRPRERNRRLRRRGPSRSSVSVLSATASTRNAKSSRQSAPASIARQHPLGTQCSPSKHMQCAASKQILRSSGVNGVRSEGPSSRKG